MATDLVETAAPAAAARPICVADFLGRISKSLLEGVIIEITLHLQEEEEEEEEEEEKMEEE